MLSLSYFILCSIITITHDIPQLYHEENWFSVHAIKTSATLLNPEVIEPRHTIPHFRAYTVLKKMYF